MNVGVLPSVYCKVGLTSKLINEGLIPARPINEPTETFLNERDKFTTFSNFSSLSKVELLFCVNTFSLLEKYLSFFG